MGKELMFWLHETDSLAPSSQRLLWRITILSGKNSLSIYKWPFSMLNDQRVLPSSSHSGTPFIELPTRPPSMTGPPADPRSRNEAIRSAKLSKNTSKNSMAETISIVSFAIQFVYTHSHSIHITISDSCYIHNKFTFIPCCIQIIYT